MRPLLKVLVIAGTLLTASLGASASASAATPAPQVMDTSVFACGNGVCEVGPGNVGVPFAAGLNVTGDGVTQSVEKFYGDDFTMKIISGSLPPGLQLTLPSSEWTVTGTPAKAGTYPFALTAIARLASRRSCASSRVPSRGNAAAGSRTPVVLCIPSGWPGTHSTANPARPGGGTGGSGGPGP